MAVAKTLPLTVSCSMHTKAMQEAQAWVSKGSGTNTLEVKTYMAGFDTGFYQCLRALHEAGYIVRGGSQPADKDKAARRQRQQTERLLKDVARQCENL
jgi:hypothetical protein